jgi:hypothetical protein
MLFFVVVAVAGVSMLSISQRHQIDTIRNGYDVRLLIAAEAGIETVGGRFTLIKDVQEDWNVLLPDPTNWNDIGGPMTINGIQVQAQGISTGTPAVPRARVRAIATLLNRNRVVEYEIRVPSFSDFAMYSGSSNGLDIPAFGKFYGPVYSTTNINLSNRAGIEFFGEVSCSGVIQNAPDPAYNFKQGFQQLQPLISLPPTAQNLPRMRDAALASNSWFGNNTVSITFIGNNQYRRFFYRRESTSGPKNGQYMLRSEVLNVPDDSVIYVSLSNARPGQDTIVGLNNTWDHLTNVKPLDFFGGTLGMPGAPGAGARVTLACEMKIDVRGSMVYQTLLENPDLRRVANKESAAALGFREMIGVVSDLDFTAYCGDWAPLPAASAVAGHALYQFPLDGVFMSNVRLNATASSPIISTRELWLNGGLIAGTQNLNTLSSHFGVLNYHTD